MSHQGKRRKMRATSGNVISTIRETSTEFTLQGRCNGKYPFTAMPWQVLLLLSRFSHVRLCATPQTAAYNSRIEQLIQSLLQLLNSTVVENPMDGGAWQAAVHGVARSRTRLSGFTFPFHFHALEKEMATHSSVLAWRIPGMGEAWWAAVSGVTQSQTRLKRLSSSSRK